MSRLGTFFGTFLGLLDLWYSLISPFPQISKFPTGVYLFSCPSKATKNAFSTRNVLWKVAWPARAPRPPRPPWPQSTAQRIFPLRAPPGSGGRDSGGGTKKEGGQADRRLKFHSIPQRVTVLFVWSLEVLVCNRGGGPHFRYVDRFLHGLLPRIFRGVVCAPAIKKASKHANIPRGHGKKKVGRADGGGQAAGKQADRRLLFPAYILTLGLASTEWLIVNTSSFSCFFFSKSSGEWAPFNAPHNNYYGGP